MCNLDNDWANFLTNNDIDSNNSIEPRNSSLDISNEETSSKCSDLYISTKTIIAYLNQTNIDIKQIFWKIPVIPYSCQEEGIIKKQIKFATTEKLELDEVQQKLINVPFYEEQIIEHIDNPDGRIKFKDQRKISIGICKKDILSYKNKKKRAFFNCFVIIFRVRTEDNNINEFKEMHVKVFNTGKLEIPGVQSDKILDKIINMLIDIMKPFIEDDIQYDRNNNQTVLINSNFNCGFYIDRDKFHDILKYKYRINSSFDSCSYPGIQCKFYYIVGKEEQTGEQPENDVESLAISFMVFRTGSILIVGKGEQYVLEEIYEHLKVIIANEYHNITMGDVANNVQNNNTNEKPMKKLRKKTINIL